MTTWQAISICASLIVSAIILSWKGFFGGYGQTRGKNLADTHDVTLLLDQLRRQKHEDMKREASLDIMRAYGTLLQASLALFGVASERNLFQHRLDVTNGMRDKSSEKHDAAYQKYQAAMTTFWQLEQIARLTEFISSSWGVPWGL